MRVSRLTSLRECSLANYHCSGQEKIMVSCCGVFLILIFVDITVQHGYLQVDEMKIYFLSLIFYRVQKNKEVSEKLQWERQ